MTIPIIVTRQGDMIFKGTETTTIMCEDCGRIWARVEPGQTMLRCCRTHTLKKLGE